jgi:hypothetical protein
MLKRQRLSSRPSAVEFAITAIVAALSLFFLLAALTATASDIAAAALLLIVGFLGLAVSVIPVAASRWRDGVDAELRRTGVRSKGTVIQVRPTKVGRNVSIVRYEYLAPDGARRFGEAYDWSELIKLKSGDRGDVLVLRDRPDLSMWVTGA